ncbi:MAG: phosphatase PAP2 family protein [Bacteroidota bacterium]
MTDLIQLDNVLFHWLNDGCANGLLDAVMPYWRSKYFWIPLYLFGASFLLINFGRKGLYYIFVAVLTIAMTDLSSSQLMKKSVKRPRPCHVMTEGSDLNLLVRCGGGYSFPSSHASNHFALAMFVGLTIGRRYAWLRWGMLLWALSIGFGQIYVGVHYPLDILGGALLGSFIAWVMSLLYRQLDEWELQWPAVTTHK